VKLSRIRRRREAGYAVLLAIFLVATMLLLAAAAAPNILTQGRRLREQEAIWRGNQYVRAIRLYYQKNGKYPASLEDLSKANAVGVHFLRKTYNEPMSPDGKWRLIYVTPAGQLIGSVHFHNLQEMAVSAAFAGQMAGGAAGFASQVFGQPDAGPAGGAQPSTTGQQIGAQPGQQNGSPSGQPSGAPQLGLSGQNSPNSLMSSAQPAPLEAVDSPVFGGSVIGVASKVKQSSITVYQGGKTYFEWEFIWNPLLNANGGAAGQQVVVPGLNGPAQPGAVPNPAALPGGANTSPNSPGTLPGTMPIAPQPVPGPRN
jgi:type II secretory pathway pseudopilin PulG